MSLWGPTKSKSYPMSDPENKPPESKPKRPINPGDFMHMVPSSLASAPAPAAPWRYYSVSVQRKKPEGGRWLEIASWTFYTNENDMIGPLSCGLRSNYRLIILEKDSNHDTKEQPANERRCIAGSNPPARNEAS